MLRKLDAGRCLVLAAWCGLWAGPLAFLGWLYHRDPVGYGLFGGAAGLLGSAIILRLGPAARASGRPGSGGLPRRFRYPAGDGRGGWIYGCYFPDPDLVAWDRGHLGTGLPTSPGLEWIDG